MKSNTIEFGYGLNGLPSYEEWDELFGLGKKGKQKREVRRTKKKQRHDVRIERKTLKNDQRRAETESLRSDTTIAKAMTIGPTSTGLQTQLPSTTQPTNSNQVPLQDQRGLGNPVVILLGAFVLVGGVFMIRKLTSSKPVIKPQ